MGVSLLASPISIGGGDVRVAMRSTSFNGRDSDSDMKSPGSKRKLMLAGSISFNGRELEKRKFMEENANHKSINRRSREMRAQLPDTGSQKNLQMRLSGSTYQRHEAALKLQKTYKSFRIRRQLADCAVLVEQRWWKLLDFAELKRSSISFFEIEKPETAISRWSRARTRAAKVGKGLSKCEKARKLALQHWLEAIDPRHRYGHNLQFYYAKWLHCDSKQPFFYWLDVGEGKEVTLDRCPRSKLQYQCIKYLGPIERGAYEVIVEEGKFIYKQSRQLIDTRGGPADAKWIFVLSASKNFYVGLKKKGTFQHSSFLAGGATLSAGRLVVEDGVLKAVWPHSGHYLPTEENFVTFIAFLREKDVDLSNVKKCSSDGEEEAFVKKTGGSGLQKCQSHPDFTQAGTEEDEEEEEGANKMSDRERTKSKKPHFEDSENSHLPMLTRSKLHSKITTLQIPTREDVIEVFKHNLYDEDEDGELAYKEPVPKEKILQRINSHKLTISYQLAQHLQCKWTTGAGPRIGCVRDYPSELQFQVLEEVSLSPRSKQVSPRRFSRLTPSKLCRGSVERSPITPERMILSQMATP